MEQNPYYKNVGGTINMDKEFMADFMKTTMRIRYMRHLKEMWNMTKTIENLSRLNMK